MGITSADAFTSNGLQQSGVRFTPEIIIKNKEDYHNKAGKTLVTK